MEEKNEKMELIDFDDKFTQVLNDWVEKNQTRWKRPCRTCTSAS